MNYRTLHERINRLASGLENLGVKRGDTICIFDFDSHRYLESYFAIPMIGAGDAHHELAFVTQSNRLYDEPRRRRCHYGQLRISPPPRGDPGQTDDGEENHPPHRR